MRYHRQPIKRSEKDGTKMPPNRKSYSRDYKLQVVKYAAKNSKKETALPLPPVLTKFFKSNTEDKEFNVFNDLR